MKRAFILSVLAALVVGGGIGVRSAAGSGSRIGYNSRVILLARKTLDPAAHADNDTWIEDSLNSVSTQSLNASGQLRIVQFEGPIKVAWLRQLKQTGAAVIGYVPNNAYLISGSSASLRRVAALHAESPAQANNKDAYKPVSWMGRLDPIMKIASSIDDATLYSASSATIEIEIELWNGPGLASTLSRIETILPAQETSRRSFSQFTVITASLPIKDILEIASIDEVIFIAPHHPLELFDERSAQIIAGNLTADKSRPIGPGYLGWLQTVGLGTAGEEIIDITDTGLDRASTDAARLHPDFLDSDGNSRVVYDFSYTEEQQIEDRLGHGTLVASVTGGSTFSQRLDDGGYYFGLGVAPHARLGSSRIFRTDGKIPPLLSFTAVVSAAYAAGARVSNNSWGQTGNIYDATAQEYDTLVRDAQPGVSGNQEMTLVFSAGNAGPGGRISSPSSAKNVISVAASENYRPDGTDSCDLDGKGPIGPDGANDAKDILRFSSGGPVDDGRCKPDITAPGTHVSGAISLSNLFNASGLCPGLSPDQSIYPLYTWSSGTSLAAPHVSGAASLLREFFKKSGKQPSPAMTKAYLANSASYLNGTNAGGSLPSERQGWGLLDLSRAFDDTKRLLIDQTELLTESGQTFQVRGSVADPSRPLRITLAWTDAPGMAFASPWVNDLDLEVSINGKTLYRGNNFNGPYSVSDGEPDRLNNMEGVYLPAGFLPAGADGNFTITIRAINIGGDGVPGNGIDLDQDFALVVYNYAPPVEESKVKITAASFQGKSLVINGAGFASNSQVEINGRVLDREFDFDSAVGTLSTKGKAKKLNLKADQDNMIVVISGPDRSDPFTLRI